MAKKTQENIDTSKKTEEKLASSLKIIENELKQIEEERAELGKDAIANAERLRDLRNEEAKQQRARLKLEEQIDELAEKRNDDYADLESLSRKFEKSLEAQKRSWEKLSPDAKSFAGDVGKSAQLTEKMNVILKTNLDLHKTQGSLSSEYQTTIKQSTDYLSLRNSLQTQMLDQVDQAVVGEYKSVDASQQKKMLDEAREQLQENRNKMSEEEIGLVETTIAAMQESYDQTVAMNDALNETSKDAKAVLGTFDSMMKLDLKGAIRNWFKLDEINNDIKKNLRGSLANVVKEFRGEGGLVGGLKAAGSALKNMVSMAPKLALGLGIGAIAAGIGMLVKSVMAADEEIANMGKELGVSHHEAGMLHGETQRMAAEMNIAGINAKELYEGVKIASDAMGGIDIGAQLAAGNKEIEGFVKQSAILSKQFGMSGEEIGKIKDIATITGKSMDTLVKESVELGKGTMTAKQSLKILSTIPPSVTVAFKGSTKELIAAAQKAKLLGMELGKVQQIGRGMLDIEQSLEAEMEARVLTGKNLNLDAARQYALQGNTFKLQEEILNQAGSLEDFTKMNTLQQESMAKALGMSVEEMTSMLTNAEKLKKAGIDEVYQQQLDSLKDTADFEKELDKQRSAGASQEKLDYIQQLAREKQSASIKEKMGDMLEKIKARLSPIVEAITKMAHEFFDSAKGASQFDDIIGSIDIPALVADIKAVLPQLLEGFKNLIKNLPPLIKMVAGFVSKLSGGIGPMSSIIGMVNPGIAGFGIMALKVGGPGGVAAGFKLAGKLAGGLFDVVKGPLTTGISKLAGGVTDKLGGAFGKVTDKAKSGLGGVMEKMGKVKTPEAPKSGGGGFLKGLTDAFKNVNTTDLIKAAAAMLILAAALYVVAKALQEFGRVEWESVAKGGVALLGLVGITHLLSEGSTKMIKGAAAMVILGAALLVIGFALQMFTKIGWEDLAKAGVALVGFSLAVAGLGFLLAPIAVGVAALAILSVGILAFSASMMVFSKAANMALPFFKELFVFLGPIIQGFAGILMAIADGIKTVANSLASAVGGFMEIAKTDPSKLFTIAGGITAIGFALAALGAGSGGGALASGFGNLVGGLMGGDSPLEMLTQISTKLDPEKLSATVLAIRALADAFQYFAEKTAALKDFDTDKLETIIQKMEEVRDAQSGGVGGAITGAANAVTGFLGNIFGSSEKQTTQPVTAGGGGSVAVAASSGGTNMANVEKKLDTLISVISQAANQPLIIKFGEKTIEEIRTQLNLKKATNMNEKGYAKSI